MRINFRTTQRQWKKSDMTNTDNRMITRIQCKIKHRIPEIREGKDVVDDVKNARRIQMIHIEK